MNPALLRAPRLALPTLALAGLTTTAWLLTAAGALQGALPLGLAAPLCALLAYVSFTPLHDATHQAVARARWLNGLVGRLAALPLLAPYPAFRVMHLAHHRHTNEPERDPDHWSGRGPGWALPLRWLSQDLHYYVRLIREPSLLRPLELLEVVLAVGAQLAALALALRAGIGLEFALVVLLPTRLATAALAFGFDYLPHRPHDTPARVDRFRASHVLREPWLTLPLCAQNFHLVHHLYPAVPFYRYGAVWRDQREALLARGAEERSLFGAPATSGSAPSPR